MVYRKRRDAGLGHPYFQPWSTSVDWLEEIAKEDIQFKVVIRLVTLPKGYPWFREVSPSSFMSSRLLSGPCQTQRRAGTLMTSASARKKRYPLMHACCLWLLNFVQSPKGLVAPFNISRRQCRIPLYSATC